MTKKNNDVWCPRSDSPSEFDHIPTSVLRWVAIQQSRDREDYPPICGGQCMTDGAQA